MYNVGDLVRVKYGKHKGYVYVVKGIDRNMLGEGIYLYKDLKGKTLDNLEPVTHLTTKEFIKLVEDMGLEINRYGEYIMLSINSRHIGAVYTDRMYYFELDEFNTINYKNLDILYKLFHLYANTPLELREEKEQLYTLRLPDTASCYRYYSKDNYEYLFDDIHDDNGYQNKFTQKEIDELKQGSHGDLIKALKQEPVK